MPMLIRFQSASSWARAARRRDRRPRVTHTGKVRRDDQDHFLLCSLRRQLVVRGSSVPGADGLLGDSERLASLAMVADGVGGANRGETASRFALTTVTKYVSRSMGALTGPSTTTRSSTTPGASRA